MARASYPVQTPYGVLNATPANRNYLNFSSESVLRINGVPYRVHVRISRPDPSQPFNWHRDEGYERAHWTSAAYVRRPDRISNDQPSESAWKAIEGLLPLLQRWAEANPRALLEAEIASLNARLEEHDEKIAKLNADLEAAQKQRIDTHLALVRLSEESAA